MIEISELERMELTALQEESQAGEDALRLIDAVRRLQFELHRCEKRRHGSIETYLGLLTEVREQRDQCQTICYGLRTERDEAREVACKLLYIAESRGPKVFGPLPYLAEIPRGMR